MRSITLFLLLTPVFTNAFAQWGDYPHCTAPGVPIETHSWWLEPGEHHPRHVHIATCLPHARDTTGQAVSFTGATTYPVRVMAFNNPGRLSFVRNGWQETVSGGMMSQVDGANRRCQTGIDALTECTWWENLVIDSNEAVNSGLQELRMTPDIRHADLGTRQFATLNYQVYVKNGKPVKNYRNGPIPIARSWYTGFDYANVELQNYMALFTSPNQTIPTVSGVVPLRVKHSSGKFTVTSYLFLNPDFHSYPHAHHDPQADPTGKTKLLYKKSGRFNGIYEWDTRGLPNGTHVLYFQTEDKSAAGLHAGAMKLFFNVQNGTQPPPAEDPPVGECP